MATVPRVTTAETQPTALRPVYQESGAELFAPRIAQGRSIQRAGNEVQQFADQVGDLALKQKIEDNEREAKQLDVAYADAIRKIGYGDDGQAGFYSTQGQNTVDAYGNASAQLSKIKQQLLDSASNDEVKFMFDQVSSRRLNTEMEDMSRYLGKERRVANAAASAARIESFGQDASLRWSDPAALNTALSGIAGELKSAALDGGWSDDELKTQTQKATSDVVTNVLKTAINNDIDQAQKMFSSYSQLLTSKQRIDVEGDIKTAVKSREIERKQDAILARQALADQQTAAENDMITTYATDRGKVTPLSISQSNMSPGDKRYWIRWIEGEANQGGTHPEDNPTFMTFWNRMHANEGDDNRLSSFDEVNDAVGKGLSVKDRNTLKTEWDGLQKESTKFESDLKSRFTALGVSTISKKDPLYNILDNEGDKRAKQFLQDFTIEYEEKRKQGLTPDQLLNPKSKDYMGSMIDKYVRAPDIEYNDLINDNPQLSPDNGQINVPGVTEENEALKLIPKDDRGRLVPQDKAQYDLIPSGVRYMKMVNGKLEERTKQ